MKASPDPVALVPQTKNIQVAEAFVLIPSIYRSLLPDRKLLELRDCSYVQREAAMRAFSRLPIYSAEEGSGDLVVPPFRHCGLVESRNIGLLIRLFRPVDLQAPLTATPHQNDAVMSIAEDIGRNTNALVIEEIRPLYDVTQFRADHVCFGC